MRADKRGRPNIDHGTSTMITDSDTINSNAGDMGGAVEVHQMSTTTPVSSHSHMAGTSVLRLLPAFG